ncbi:VCBS repeat-containing protein, partial [bacterium]
MTINDYLKMSSVCFMIFILFLISSHAYSQYPQLFIGPRQAGSAIDASIADACAGDVDNDGDLDLICAYPAGPELAVCYNDGAASFSQPWYANEKAGTADLVQSVATADLNGDGYLDLIAATWNGYFGDFGDEKSIAVNLNNGDGTFAEAYMIPVLDRTTEVVTADFDNDGDMDIAATHRDTAAISVVLNQGDATFTAFQDYPVVQDSWSIYCAEISGDGFMDLIVLTTGNLLKILLNQEDGTFYTETLTLENGLQHVHGGDVDGDGDHDLITVNSITNKIKVLTNQGNGSFVVSQTYQSEHWLNSVAVADFTGDGYLDFCVANYDTSTVTIYKGYGNGIFSELDDWFIGDTPHDLFSADLNDDGYEDIVVCANNLWAISILNQGDGTFETQDRYYHIGSEPFAIEAADFNGDGFNDIVFYLYGYTIYSKYVGVSFNDGCGYFSDPQYYGISSWPLSHDYGNRHPITVGDYDNDGDIDIVAANRYQSQSNSFNIFDNDGSGVFNAQSKNYQVDGSKILNLGSSDIDADGDIDIIATYQSGLNYMCIFYNNGDGEFNQTAKWPESCSAIFKIDDFNQDGYNDIIYHYYDSLKIFLNIGNGAFDCHAFETDEGGDFSIGDYDNDGDKDVAFIYRTTSMISQKGYVYLNNHFQEFVRGTYLYFPGQSPSYVVDADIDNDGDLDIIGITSWNRAITVNINGGDGRFDVYDPALYSTIGRPRAMVASDFNNDGFVDIATMNHDYTREEGTMTLLINASSGQSPELGINPLFLSFGTVDSSQSFEITNTGNGTLIWNVSVVSGSEWIRSVKPSNSTGNASIEVQISREGLDAGDYSGTIQITSNGGTLELSVEMTVSDVLPCFWADIDCDGDVDVVDIQMVAGKWMTDEGDANYNPLCDVNNEGQGDGKIDIVDIQLVAGWWGKEIPDNQNMSKLSKANNGDITLQLKSLGQDDSGANVFALYVENAGDVGAFQFDLVSQSDPIELKSIELGALAETTQNSVQSLSPLYSEDNMRMTFGAYSFGSEKGMTGNGDLVEMTIDGITLSDLVLENIIFTDCAGNEIPANLVTSVEKKTPAVPETYELSQNYPNPFNPITNITFGIPNQQQSVRVQV